MMATATLPAADRSEEPSAASALLPGPRVRPYADVVELLRRPIPREYLKTKERSNRKSGSKTLLWFIPWYRVCAILDKYFVWKKEVLTVTQIGGDCVVAVRLSILCDLGDGRQEWIGKDGEGRCPIDQAGYGDQVSNSVSMAFRRAAANWGLGRHLYEKDSAPVPVQPSGGFTRRIDPPRRRVAPETHPSSETETVDDRGEVLQARPQAPIELFDRIDTLLEQLGDSPQKLKGMLRPYKVERFDQLPEAAARKVIEMLEARVARLHASEADD